MVVADHRIGVPEATTPAKAITFSRVFASVATARRGNLDEIIPIKTNSPNRRTTAIRQSISVDWVHVPDKYYDAEIATVANNAPSQ